MNPEFTALTDERPGTIAALLRASYAALVRSDSRWASEPAAWDTYDREVFANLATVGACLFLTRLDTRVLGFASWDPRQRPTYGIVGHNCILPEFRGQCLGQQQIREILRRFRALGIRTAKVSTCAHPFFVSAQRMYAACDFREVRRTPHAHIPDLDMIEYELDLTAS